MRAVVVADTALETIAETVSGNPRGVILWRDEPAWLARLGDAGKTAAIAPAGWRPGMPAASPSSAGRTESRAAA